MQFEKLPSDIMVNHIFPEMRLGDAFNLAQTLSGHKEFKAIVGCGLAAHIGGIPPKRIARAMVSGDYSFVISAIDDELDGEDYCWQNIIPGKSSRVFAIYGVARDEILA